MIWFKSQNQVNPWNKYIFPAKSCDNNKAESFCSLSRPCLLLLENRLFACLLLTSLQKMICGRENTGRRMNILTLHGYIRISNKYILVLVREGSLTAVQGETQKVSLAFFLKYSITIDYHMNIAIIFPISWKTCFYHFS